MEGAGCPQDSGRNNQAVAAAAGGHRGCRSALAEVLPAGLELRLIKRSFHRTQHAGRWVPGLIPARPALEGAAHGPRRRAKVSVRLVVAGPRSTRLHSAPPSRAAHAQQLQTGALRSESVGNRQDSARSKR